MNTWSLKRLKRPLSVLATVYGSLLIFVPGPVFGEVGLRVVTDIAPVQSLVWRVMDGLGEPAVLVPPGTSPHHYALRPSDASVLQQADLVFFVGAGLTPWLEGRLPVLSPRADKVNLSSAPGVVIWPYRTLALSHEDESEDGHEHSHGNGHGHSHGDADDAVDPHMWLDPANALVWLDAIASELGHIDPENAARYRANANTAKAEISHEIHHIEDHLKSVQGQGFLVFHDAYQYFENRFGISATGSISIGDASKPNAKRLQELKHHFEEEGIHCVLSEPQYSSKLIDSVFGGFKPHIGVADPIGVDLELGSGLYLELLENLASGIAECVNH